MSLTKVTYAMIDGALLNVKDFGAVGDGVANDTAAIQAAFDSPGLSPIYFPVGTYKVTGSGAACLTLTKNRSLIGSNSRTSIIRADSAGASTDVLKIAITDNGGYLDVRNFQMQNLALSQNGGGRHAVYIDATAGLPMFSAVFDSLNLGGYETNNGCAFAVSGQGFAFNSIQNCTCTGTIALDGVADGNRVLNNVVFGLRIGLYLNIVEGSYTTLVKGNTIVNRDGQIKIYNGSQILIDGNQLEQYLAYGPNTATYGPQVRIIGNDRPCDSIWLTHNNFAGGLNCANCLVIENAINTRITQNVFCGSGSNTTNVDVLLLSNSSYNYLYFDNARGLSTGRTDQFNLAVTDQGTGNFGTLNQTLSPSSGGYGAGATYYKDPSTEEVVLGASSGGSTTAGTVIITLPTGFKPYATNTLPAASSAGAFVVETNATTGDVTCKTAAPSDTNVAQGVRFAAKRGA